MVTVANLITNLDTYLGDSSTDRISQAERFQALTESVSWLQEELGNEHMVDTYTVNYLQSVNAYKVTTGLADLLVGADLRRERDQHDQSFARKSPRDIWEEIGQRKRDPSWAIERKDGDAYLVINFEGEHDPTILSSMDTLTSGGGTWVVDSSSSDATNLTADVNEKKQGSGSLNFDIDVSQTANNYATIYVPDSTSRDLSSLEDLGSFIFWVYIPDKTYTTSFTLFWSDETSVIPSTKSKYWSATVTTDINGNSFVDGWNQVKIDWQDATKTGSPDSSAIVYYEIRMTYGASQGDDTDFRYDHFRIVQPETLTFHYVSWNVGQNNSGTDITAFSATNDVPFFSGRYDQYNYAVAHKAASILYYSSLRLPEQGAIEDAQAIRALDRYRKNFESSSVREVKSFKIHGVNLRRYNKKGRIPKIR